MAWLWIFGWFLALSAAVPTLILTGIGLGTLAWSVWLRLEARHLERRLKEIDTAIAEAQARTLVSELEEFLESQP